MFTSINEMPFKLIRNQVRDLSHDLIQIEKEIRLLEKSILKKRLMSLFQDDLDDLEHLIKVCKETFLEIDYAVYPQRSFLLGNVEYYFQELQQKISAVRCLVDINGSLSYEEEVYLEFGGES